MDRVLSQTKPEGLDKVLQQSVREALRKDGGPASYARTQEVLYQGLLGLAVLPESLAALA